MTLVRIMIYFYKPKCQGLKNSNIFEILVTSNPLVFEAIMKGC